SAGVGCSNTISVGSSTPSHSSSSTRKKTDAAESIPRRANFACGRMRSTGVLKVLARYAMHQSRISDSMGLDFTGQFTAEGQLPGIGSRLWTKIASGLRRPILFRGEASCLDLIGRRRGIAIERLHRFARIFRQILADEIELAQELVRHRDDVAITLLGVEDIQELAGASPKQFRLGSRGGNLLARTHMRDRIDAGIGDAPGENRDNRRCCRMERVDDGADLIEREDRGDVERHAFGRERADELARGLPLGVGAWTFNVNVPPPS